MYDIPYCAPLERGDWTHRDSIDMALLCSAKADLRVAEVLSEAAEWWAEDLYRSHYPFFDPTTITWARLFHVNWAGCWSVYGAFDSRVLTF